MAQVSPNGRIKHKWSPQEDHIVRREYPSYQKLRGLLPHRSLAALKNRARILGIVRRKHIWTNQEVKRLVVACTEKIARSELFSLFPNLRRNQVAAKAKHLNLTLPRIEPKITGVSAIDEIRARAVARGIKLTDLDRQAGTGRYFQQVKYRPVLKHIVKAAAFLGGEISIQWSEL